MKTLIPLRLSPGQDLKKSLTELGIQLNGAFVISGIGSLSTLVIRLAGAKENLILKEDLEILSLQGTLTGSGVHLHIAVSDRTGKVKGGHLQEGSIIRTTAEILVAQPEGYLLSREIDAETGYLELIVRKCQDTPKK